MSRTRIRTRNGNVVVIHDRSNGLAAEHDEITAHDVVFLITKENGWQYKKTHRLFDGVEYSFWNTRVDTEFYVFLPYDEPSIIRLSPREWTSTNNHFLAAHSKFRRLRKLDSTKMGWPDKGHGIDYDLHDPDSLTDFANEIISRGPRVPSERNLKQGRHMEVLVILTLGILLGLFTFVKFGYYAVLILGVAILFLIFLGRTIDRYWE